MLGVTEVSVNRMLQPARQTVDREVLPGELDAAPLPDSPHERELVSRFANAFQAGDIEGVVTLLTDDALLTMPPEPLEFQGPADRPRSEASCRRFPPAARWSASCWCRLMRTGSQPSAAT
jgi:hypothetical protein